MKGLLPPLPAPMHRALQTRTNSSVVSMGLVRTITTHLLPSPPRQFRLVPHMIDLAFLESRSPALTGLPYHNAYSSKNIKPPS